MAKTLAPIPTEDALVIDMDGAYMIDLTNPHHRQKTLLNAEPLPRPVKSSRSVSRQREDVKTLVLVSSTLVAIGLGILAQQVGICLGRMMA